MAQASTVYLTRAIEPSKTTWVKGYIIRHDDKGVWINDRDDGRGETVFYPTHLIEKIAYETGW